MPSTERSPQAQRESFHFQLPPKLEAGEPAEVRGSGRDDVRLLVATGEGSLRHARFRELTDYLHEHDVLVFNRSATLPASLAARRANGEVGSLSVSTRMPADLWVVEARDFHDLKAERLALPGNASAELLTAYRDSPRLWVARLRLPMDFVSYAQRCGRVVAYRHTRRRWPLSAYQNIYATEPGSAEMASAGRPFTHEMFAELRKRGIDTAFITLHTGVSSPHSHEPPYEETYRVPVETAKAVARARERGGRVIAVGTTVVRALESSLDERCEVVASRGWTNLVIDPSRDVYAVDGLITGFHEPRSTHLAMLEAIAGSEVVARVYRNALSGGYLWHEFGDSNLLLPSPTRAFRAA